MKTYNTALIIDDDQDLCLTLKSVLNRTIPSIHFAHTIAQGKKSFKAISPDVIFLDNNLPDGQGLHIIKELRQERPLATIILISALDITKNKAIEYGANSFLEKPFTMASIFDALRLDYPIN